MLQFLRKLRLLLPMRHSKPRSEIEGLRIDCTPTSRLEGSLLVEEGAGNEIIVGEQSHILGAIRIKGSGHRIDIGRNVKISSHILIQGEANHIAIGNDVTLGGQLVIKGRGQLIEVGPRTTARDVRILCQEGGHVKIGRDCLFSRQVEIRTTDSHALVSRETGERINKPGPVEIGDHVWMGLDVIVSKCVRIASDNVVGAKSFVSGQYTESGTVIAGVPAKVVKRGVTWQRDRKARYDLDRLDDWKMLAIFASLYSWLGLLPLAV